MQSLLGEEGVGKIRATVVRIALVTFFFEAVGALLLYTSVGAGEFATDGKRIFFAVFHSISSFCNAGFTLTTENLAASFLQFNVGLNMTVMGLVVLGGLGFPVLSNLGTFLSIRPPHEPRPRLTLHSKVVLLTTGALLLIGAVGFFILEDDNLLAQLSLEQRVLASVFHSVSARTAGFNTVDIGALSVPTLFLLTLLMWIGASPGSTGGGIKTTSFTLSLLNIYSIASGRNKVELFRKQAADISIVKAFSTIVISFFVINGALYALLLTEQYSFQVLLFEVVSAVGTVGFSTGITADLTVGGKSIIILCMFVGRVGLLAMLVAMTRRRDSEHYDYTQEQVLVT
jgi:Trk-type K+ transport system membrane component